MRSTSTAVAALVLAACAPAPSIDGRTGVSASAPAAVSDGVLGLAVATDAPSYAPGETITLVATLQNRGPRSLTLVHPDYWGVSVIEVVDEHDRTVEPETWKGKRKAVAELMTIPAGEARSHSFPALGGWTCCYGYSFAALAPGRYRARLRLENPPRDVTPPQAWTRDWTGELVSELVAFEVRGG